eukprot:XP_004918975.1 PREDICTED: SLAM family member 5-like [Xenopus tropicalis]
MELHRLSGTKGDSILFPVQVPNHTEVFSVLWTHNDKILAVAKQQQLEVKNMRFNGRLQAMGPGYSLILTHLETDDSGKYTAQIFTDSEPGATRISFILQVDDKSTAGRSSCTLIFTLFITTGGLCFNAFAATGA